MIPYSLTKRFIINKFFGTHQFVIIKDLYNNVNSQISITDTNCIIKKISNKEYYDKEIKALQDLTSSPDIISIIQFWQEIYSYNDNTSYNIMLPYYKDGDLFGFVTSDKYKLVDYKSIFKKLLPSIKFCHDNDYIHIDIKLENFLIELNSDNTIKNIVLIDFGMAYKMDDNDIKRGYVNLDKCYGTPQYLNPEKNDKIYGKFTDIWCLGIIYYIFMFREYPNKNFRNSSSYLKLTLSKLEFINALLDENFMKRPSIDKIINNPFLNN